MAQIECWLGSFGFFQAIRTSIANKPYIFVIFQGGPDPLPRSRAAKEPSLMFIKDIL